MKVFKGCGTPLLIDPKMMSAVEKNVSGKVSVALKNFSSSCHHLTFPTDTDPFASKPGTGRFKWPEWKTEAKRSV
jgi:hypothetical protein